MKISRLLPAALAATIFTCSLGREKYSVQKSREDEKKAVPDLRKRRA
jgi:hypothetical protein